MGNLSKPKRKARALKEDALTLEAFLEILTKHRISLSPVIGKGGGKGGKILFWHVGQRQLAGDGWTNVVMKYEQDADLITAIEKLLPRLK